MGLLNNSGIAGDLLDALKTLKSSGVSITEGTKFNLDDISGIASGLIDKLVDSGFLSKSGTICTILEKAEKAMGSADVLKGIGKLFK